MPTVLLHYFSGTGNTKHAVDVITSHLKENGYEVKQLLIGPDRPEIAKKIDYHIFAFPVLSFAAPVFVKKYIRRLPLGQNVKTAVFATFGGDPAQAIQNIQRILQRKKFDVFLTGGARYPNNWAQMTNPPTETEVVDIIQRGDQEALRFAKDFIKGEQRFHRTGRLAKVITGTVAALFALIGRRFLGKTYIADAKCNQCGICSATCPVHTIKMRGIICQKPQWGFRCQDCGRCINICPKKAIQVSVPRMLLHTIIMITLITVAFRIPGLLVQHFEPSHQSVVWIISLILSLTVALYIQFTVIDGLFFLLEQIPAVRRFFEVNFTKNFRRYFAPGFKPQSALDTALTNGRKK